MKKFTLGMLGVITCLLSSCDTNNDETTNTFNYVTTNYITSLDGREVYVTPGLYRFFFNLTQEKGEVSTNNLKIGGNTYTFVSAENPLNAYYFTEGTMFVMKNVKAAGSGANVSISDGNFLLSSLFYYANVPTPGISNSNPVPAIVAQYNVNDQWKVRTFSRDAFYVGTTTTDIPGSGVPTYTNEKMIYRVVLDIENKKATVVIYNARFAENMPMELTGIILKDLDANWEVNGYSITGKDIIPDVIEGASSTPYENFIFNSFELATTNDKLTQVSINYQVAGRYLGSFKGSYLYENDQLY